MPVDRTAASTFSASVDAPSEARRFVRETLAGWGRELAIEPAQLLVSELVTNAVVHGGHGVVIVRVSVDEPWLRLEVSDANAREYPRLKVPHDYGARGLHIVDAVASAWGCSPVGERKTVWCEVPLVAGGSRTTG